ncbi:DUF2516 family protein [Arthrobacter sp. H14-L1]|uniref:DUF2516 family protein n=1 Tax=Arthrobacter sp. H14-L1 TaxID=2996697 RepID=UPI002D1E48E7|nr:DUF2516 family protein [Arthrobacter sp. H14-L1]
MLISHILIGTVPGLLLQLLGLLALALSLWALADCLRTKPSDFERMDKRTKGFWVGITLAATVVSALFVLTPVLGFFLIFELAATTGAGVYLADVRPAVSDARRGGKRNRGPYGSW